MEAKMIDNSFLLPAFNPNAINKATPPVPPKIKIERGSKLS
jgi:hypothetical protein